MTQTDLMPSDNSGRNQLAVATTVLDQYSADEADEGFATLPPRRRPVSPLTQLLATCIALAVAFTVGVLVQKEHDSVLVSTAASFPGAGGAGFLVSGGSGSSASSSGTGPVLVGTVVSVSGNDVTVKDLGGTTHVVHTSPSTTVTVTSQSSVASLKPGSTVSVDGTRSSDGSVSATAVTVR